MLSTHVLGILEFSEIGGMGARYVNRAIKYAVSVNQQCACCSSCDMFLDLEALPINVCPMFCV